jgi:hypothetical protein
MTKKYLLFLVSLLLTCSVMGQATAIEINAPESVTAGTGFRIVYTVNETSGKFLAPRFDESFSVNGPSISTSHSTQWINGNMSSTSSTTYMFFVVAQKEGTFTIPPAQYAMKNATVSSASLTINVSNSQSSASGGGVSTSSGQRQSSSGEEVYLRFILSSDQVYVGQPVEVKLKIFTRRQISNPGTGISYPDFKGFLKKDIKIPQLQSLENETINGVQYGTGILDKFLLYPQMPGDIKIDRAQMQILVQEKNDFDDPFFGGSIFSNMVNTPRTISTLPVNIHVKPLPSPQPAGFSGAVGKFEMTSSISKDNVQVNDAVTYTVTLSGSGNIGLAGVPVFEVPASIEKYDPKVTANAEGNTGNKTYEFLLIPRHSGDFVIPGIDYVCFDIASGKYVTLKTPSKKITVVPGNGTSETSQPAATSTDKEDVKYLGQDIRFIKTGSYKLAMIKPSKVENTAYYLTYLLALVLTACVIVAIRQYLRMNSDNDLTRNRKAAQVAGKRLKKAQDCLKAKDYTTMHEEIAKAIWGYLSDKLIIPLSELTIDNCVSVLSDRNVPAETVSEFKSIINSCEYSRFAPSSGNDSPEEIYGRSERLIGVLENIL